MRKLIALVIAAGSISCYDRHPKPCAPNDTSCLPCEDPRSTSPECEQPWRPIPIGGSRPDAGADAGG